MKVKIYSIGQCKEDFVRLAEQEYLKRIKAYAKIELLEIGNSKTSRRAKGEQVDKESNILLSKIEAQDLLIVLDERGKQLSSIDFAKKLDEWVFQTSHPVCFAIGGACGWSDQVRARADYLLSLSKLTFTYQFSRMILIEQLYRGLSIIKGSPYHKG